MGSLYGNQGDLGAWQKPAELLEIIIQMLPLPGTQLLLYHPKK
jgi:hypothetical protein